MILLFHPVIFFLFPLVTEQTHISVYSVSYMLFFISYFLCIGSCLTLLMHSKSHSCKFVVSSPLTTCVLPKDSTLLWNSLSLSNFSLGLFKLPYRFHLIVIVIHTSYTSLFQYSFLSYVPSFYLLSSMLFYYTFSHKYSTSHVLFV